MKVIVNGSSSEYTEFKFSHQFLMSSLFTSKLQADKLTDIITQVKVCVPGGGHDVGSWSQS